MSTWQQSELEIIAATDEVTLAVEHRDGSEGTPVIMWSVVVGGEVYVRAVRGEASPWYRRALITGRGAFAVGSVRAQVMLDHVSVDEIDAAYRQKYARYAKNIVESTVTPVAKSATLRLTRSERSS